MANEFYTLIVVPHAKARFRKFQVSVRLTRWVLAAFGVMALVFVGILAHYTWIAVEVAEVRRLRAENLALATKARAYEENAGQLQGKVLQLQSIVTKLGIMAGVEQSLPDASIGGVGGLSGSETTPPSIDIASTCDLTRRWAACPKSPRGSRPTSRTSRRCWPPPPRPGPCGLFLGEVREPARPLHGPP
jgi:hypothetical protein